MAKIFEQTLHKRRYINNQQLLKKEMQTETTMKYYNMPIRMAKSQKTFYMKLW